jgi:3-phenylpropionate/trans-cinnamate dioxygenase ferredoxin component
MSAVAEINQSFCADKIGLYSPLTEKMAFQAECVMTQHVVCKVVDLPVGEMKAFSVAGTKIVLYHLKDGFYATQANCSHMFAPLAKGKVLEDCKVQCPLHRARFDIKTGEVIDWANFPPGIGLLNVVRGEKALKTYPVSVKSGDVRVKIV